MSTVPQKTDRLHMVPVLKTKICNVTYDTMKGRQTCGGGNRSKKTEVIALSLSNYSAKLCAQQVEETNVVYKYMYKSKSFYNKMEAGIPSSQVIYYIYDWDGRMVQGFGLCLETLKTRFQDPLLH